MVAEGIDQVQSTSSSTLTSSPHPITSMLLPIVRRDTPQSSPGHQRDGTWKWRIKETLAQVPAAVFEATIEGPLCRRGDSMHEYLSLPLVNDLGTGGWRSPQQEDNHAGDTFFVLEGVAYGRRSATL